MNATLFKVQKLYAKTIRNTIILQKYQWNNLWNTSCNWSFSKVWYCTNFRRLNLRISNSIESLCCFSSRFSASFCRDINRSLCNFNVSSRSFLGVPLSISCQKTTEHDNTFCYMFLIYSPLLNSSINTWIFFLPGLKCISLYFSTIPQPASKIKFNEHFY